MAKLHELKRARAALAAKTPELRTALREAKAAWRQKLEDTPPGEEIPPEAKPIEGRVTDCENMLDDHQKAIDDHDTRIGEMERSIDEDAEAAKPGDDDEGGDKSYHREIDNWGRPITPFGFGEKKPIEGKGLKASRFVLGVLLSKNPDNGGRANVAAMIERRFGDKEVAKALNTTGVSTGGALIPQYFSSELIELLRAETVVRASNPTEIDLSGGNLTIPRLAGGATAGYQGELDDMTASQETFDDIQLNAKKLTCLVPVSNDLIRRAPQNIEAIIRDDMIQTAARREDLAFILGDGTGTSPIGLVNQCAATQKIIVAPFAALDNLTILTAVVGILLTMRLLLKQNMSRMLRPMWLMSPVTEAFFMGLRDQVGGFVYRDEIVTKHTLDGIPYKTSQQLPTNMAATQLGGGTLPDGAYLFLIDFADVIIGETYRMMVDASDVASYKDGGGNMVSGWTRDQTSFRLIQEHDFAIRHQASVAVALLPGWAPAGFTQFSPGFSYFIQAPSNDSSAAPSTWGAAPPTGSNNPGNASAVAPGGTLPGRV